MLILNQSEQVHCQCKITLLIHAFTTCTIAGVLFRNTEYIYTYLDRSTSSDLSVSVLCKVKLGKGTRQIQKLVFLYVIDNTPIAVYNER